MEIYKAKFADGGGEWEGKCDFFVAIPVEIKNQLNCFFYFQTFRQVLFVLLFVNYWLFHQTYRALLKITYHS